MLGETATTRGMLALCTAILVAAALYFARAVFAPVAFSILAIALMWPLQQLLEASIPKLIASAIVLLTTLLLIGALAGAVAWAFSMIAEWLMQNAGQFQNMHLRATYWLERHSISVTGLVAGHFNVSWIIRLVQDIAGRMSNFAGILLRVVVLTMIVLLEVNECKHRLKML